MPKIYFFLILLAATIIMVSVFILNSPKSVAIPLIKPNIKPVTSSKFVENYAYEFYQVSNPSNLKLLSNLDKKLPGSELFVANSCKFLTNGSFYSKENTHIGLFVTDGITLAKSQKNNLFNGYFSIAQDNLPQISKEVPQNPRLALQSGPVLLLNSDLQKTSLATDKPARRVIVAQAKENEIYFLIIYDPNSKFSGPTLEELSTLINKINDQDNLNLTSALNLDGGSASSFYTQKIKLSEISPIGSYFCETN